MKPNWQPTEKYILPIDFDEIDNQDLTKELDLYNDNNGEIPQE